MKTYKGQYRLFHGVSKGLGVEFDESKLIKPVFKSNSFQEACKKFYLDAMQTAQRYVPQTNGEVVSLLFDFTENDKNLIDRVSETLTGITTQNPIIQTYKRQGYIDKGIIIRISLHEKLLIEEHGTQNYAFIENLKEIIHPQIKIQEINNCKKKY